eukprot:jgi/Chlat1/5494/Chrsp36S05436
MEEAAAQQLNAAAAAAAAATTLCNCSCVTPSLLWGAVLYIFSAVACVGFSYLFSVSTISLRDGWKLSAFSPWLVVRLLFWLKPEVLEKVHHHKQKQQQKLLPELEQQSELKKEVQALNTEIKALKWEREMFCAALPGSVCKFVLQANGSARIQYVSSGGLCLTGCTREEMEQLLHIHPADRPRYYKRLVECGEALEVYKSEHRLQRPDGTVRWVRAHAIPQPKDGEGNQLWFCVSVDSSDIQEAQVALRVSEERLALAMKGSTDGLWDWDMVQNQLYHSQRYSELLGYSSECLVKASVQDGRDVPISLHEDIGMHPDDVPAVTERLRAHFEDNKEYDTEARLRCANGEYRWFRVCGACVRDVDGKPVRMAGIVTDIHARKEAEFALQEAVSAAKKASQAKSQFLALMSHEIRTPLNAVTGFSALLMNTEPLSEEQSSYLTTIRSSSDALLTLVNDILDFSKIEAGKLELEKSWFEVASVVEESLDLVAAQASCKGLDVAYRVARDVPPVVWADVSRIRQILVNLFTAEGSVLVEVRLYHGEDAKAEDNIPTDNERTAPAGSTTGRGEDNNQPACRRVSVSHSNNKHVMLQFTVCDEGIGIPVDRQSLLWAAFSQVDRSTTRVYGGTGLGLAIVARLASMMNGKAWVESDPRVKPGAKFHVTVNAAIPDTPPPEATTVNSLWVEAHLFVGRKVAVLAATATSSVVADLLRRWGSQPVVVSNWQELLSLHHKETIDTCILDQQVHPHCGLAELTSDTKVIALTAHGQRQNIDNSINKNNKIATYINKPVRASQLFNALQSCLLDVHKARDECRRPPSFLLDATTATREPLKILICEDNVVNQQVLRRLLMKLGYASEVCANGLEAVQATQRQHYDVILMDLNMPVCDGLRATKLIRKEHRSIPVIVAVTAAAMLEERDLCLDNGMDLYVSKPIQPRALTEALTRCCDLLRQRRVRDLWHLLHWQAEHMQARDKARAPLPIHCVRMRSEATVAVLLLM